MKTLIATVAVAAAFALPLAAQDNGGLVLPNATTTAPTTAAPAAPAAPVAEDPSTEIIFWDSIKDSNNPEMYLAYINRYPNGVFRVIADEKVKQLLGQGSAPAPATTVPVPAQPQVVQPQIVQPMQPQVVQPQVIQPMQPQVVQPMQPQVVQPMQPMTNGKFGKGFVGNPPIDRMGPNDHNFTPWQVKTGLQRQLRRVGCYNGAIDGVWGPGSRAAVTRYNRATGNNFPAHLPNVNTWRHILQTAQGRVCW